jgi:endonuclease/exonuclease/phosphatase family metal-dependent hydrolase
MFTAATLRRNIDIILTRDSRSRIVVMGDLNDEPTNQSIMNVLQATNKRRNVLPSDLYNLFYDPHNFGTTGSYYYQGSWNMLDQIIISHNLINRTAYFSCDYDSGKVLKEDWMLYQEKSGNKIPSRTYLGDYYSGGISDHLPVYVILKK